MDINKLGEEGQNKAFILLREYFGASKVFQVDWMSLENGIYILNEVKNQEPFDSQPWPKEYNYMEPFKGQGLAIWQVKARIKFYEDTGIRPRFIVFNPKDATEVLWQWLDILEEGPYIDTDIKFRRIYPMKNFERLGSHIAIRMFGLGWEKRLF